MPKVDLNDFYMLIVNDNHNDTCLVEAKSSCEHGVSYPTPMIGSGEECKQAILEYAEAVHKELNLEVRVIKLKDYEIIKKIKKVEKHEEIVLEQNQEFSKNDQAVKNEL